MKNSVKLISLPVWKTVVCLCAAALLPKLALASQTNVPPRLGPPTLLKNGNIRFLIYNGSWGQTNIVEASTDLVRWIPVSTNVFPPTLCITCPFIVFQDSVTNSIRRFYRARNL